MSESEWIPRLMQEKVLLERKCIALEVANDKLVAELAELKAKREGMALVPVEPTLSMQIAADREDDKAFIGGSFHGATNADIWYAMLEAAPSKEGEV